MWFYHAAGEATLLFTTLGLCNKPGIQAISLNHTNELITLAESDVD